MTNRQGQGLDVLDDLWQGRTGLIQDDHLTTTVPSGLKEQVQAAADKAGVSKSYWVRQAVIRRLREGW